MKSYYTLTGFVRASGFVQQPILEQSGENQESLEAVALGILSRAGSNHCSIQLHAGLACDQVIKQWGTMGQSK